MVIVLLIETVQESAESHFTKEAAFLIRSTLQLRDAVQLITEG